MKTSNTSGFPCFVWSAEQTSGQREEVPQKPEFDYVFFNSPAGLQELLGAGARRFGVTKKPKEGCETEGDQSLKSQAS